MMRLLPDLPDVVIGIEATGEVDDDDYDDVLRPAIEDRLSRHDKVRLLYVLGEEFEGYDDDALWEDAKLGARFFTSFDRIAVVTDATWVRRSVKFLGWMIPGEVKHFPLGERDAATTWITDGA
ncbi:MAG TPA: STAS/SEC14 domain-containing protein [Ilumatobacteraceae bacterium]